MRPNPTGLAAAAMVLLLVLANAAVLWPVVPLLAHGERAEGVVVDMRESAKGRRSAPVVQFTARDGRTVRVAGSGYSSPPSARLGEQVGVLYAPDDPSAAVLLLAGEHPHRIFFAATGLVVLLAWIALRPAQKRLWLHAPGTRRSLRRTGVPAVATVLQASPGQGLLAYRIDKDPAQRAPTRAVEDFIRVTHTVHGWQPRAGEHIRRGAQFRAYLDPDDPGKAFYVDFSQPVEVLREKG